MESAVSAPVSGHIRRVAVQEGLFFHSSIPQLNIIELRYLPRFTPTGDSISQGDLIVEIVH